MPRHSPVELTEDETTRLLKSFLRGRNEVDEDDCFVLVKWAQETRAQNFVLSLMIDGSIQPIVQDGQVSVQLPPAMPIADTFSIRDEDATDGDTRAYP